MSIRFPGHRYEPTDQCEPTRSDRLIHPIEYYSPYLALVINYFYQFQTNIIGPTFTPY